MHVHFTGAVCRAPYSVCRRKEAYVEDGILLLIT